MQGHELRTLEVPMSDLDLAMQVEAVGEARVQRLRDRATDLGRQVTGAAEHGDRISRPTPRRQVAAPMEAIAATYNATSAAASRSTAISSNPASRSSRAAFCANK